MSTTISKGDVQWAKLADLPIAEREEQMLSRYRRLGELNEEECARELHALARIEYALPWEQLQAVTLSRTRVLPMLSPVTAARMALVYHDVIRPEAPGMHQDIASGQNEAPVSTSHSKGKAKAAGVPVFDFSVGERVRVKEVRGSPRPPATLLGQKGRITAVATVPSEQENPGGRVVGQWHSVLLDGSKTPLSIPNAWLAKSLM